MKVLVGSASLSEEDYQRLRGKWRNGELVQPAGAPKDLDYFTDEEVEKTGNTRVETFWHPDLAKWKWGERATLDELYTIKVSHCFWVLPRTNSWGKHTKDIMTLKKMGAKFIPELYDILYPIWVETHGPKPANLNTDDPDEFFRSGSVPRIWDHDTIHASVAYHDEPLFNRILAEGRAIYCSRKKFEALDHQTKLELVREEVYATALERDIIPTLTEENKRTFNQAQSYRKALCNTMTSLSKGWFPLWIALHLEELMSPDCNYIQRHLDNAHLLKPYGNRLENAG